MLNFTSFMGEGIIMFWTIFGVILVVKVKMEIIMMYNYGLDHRELGEHFLLLTDCPLMCEGASSSYGR